MLTDGEGNVLAADEKGSQHHVERPGRGPSCSEAGGSCGGGGGGACRRNGLRGHRGGERSRGGGAVSSSASEDSGQASADSRGRKLSVSLSVNLSDDGEVQLAEAALQLAVSSLGSRSRDEEEDDDRAPVRRLVVHQARRLGRGEGRGGRGERASAGSLASTPRKIIKEEGLDIVRAAVKSESNSVPYKRVPSTDSSNATRSTRSKRRK